MKIFLVTTAMLLLLMWLHGLLQEWAFWFAVGLTTGICVVNGNDRG